MIRAIKQNVVVLDERLTRTMYSFRSYFQTECRHFRSIVPNMMFCFVTINAALAQSNRQAGACVSRNAAWIRVTHTNAVPHGSIHDLFIVVYYCVVIVFPFAIRFTGWSGAKTWNSCSTEFSVCWYVLGYANDRVQKYLTNAQ